MDENAIIECGVCLFQGTVKQFAPTTVTANFDAPECPRCRNNEAAWFEEIKKTQEVKAA